MTMTIWIDSWQMQCCGKPFRLGSQVAWTLRAADLDWLAATLGADAQQAVDAAEEHHGGVPDHTVPTRGTSTSSATSYSSNSDSGISTMTVRFPIRGSGARAGLAAFCVAS